MEDQNLKIFSQGMAVNANGAGGTQQSLPILAAIVGLKDAKGALEALNTHGFGQTPISIVGGLWNGKWDKHIQRLTDANGGSARSNDGPAIG